MLLTICDLVECIYVLYIAAGYCSGGHPRAGGMRGDGAASAGIEGAGWGQVGVVNGAGAADMEAGEAGIGIASGDASS